MLCYYWMLPYHHVYPHGACHRTEYSDLLVHLHTFRGVHEAFPPCFRTT